MPAQRSSDRITRINRPKQITLCIHVCPYMLLITRTQTHTAHSIKHCYSFVGGVVLNKDFIFMSLMRVVVIFSYQWSWSVLYVFFTIKWTIFISFHHFRVDLNGDDHFCLIKYYLLLIYYKIFPTIIFYEYFKCRTNFFFLSSMSFSIL